MAEEKFPQNLNRVVEFNEETHEAIQIRGYVFIVPKNKEDKVRQIVEAIEKILGAK